MLSSSFFSFFSIFSFFLLVLIPDVTASLPPCFHFFLLLYFLAFLIPADSHQHYFLPLLSLIHCCFLLHFLRTSAFSLLPLLHILIFLPATHTNVSSSFLLHFSSLSLPNLPSHPLTRVPTFANSSGSQIFLLVFTLFILFLFV